MKTEHIPGELSVQELGDLIDLSPRRIQQLVNAGVLTRSRRGRYPAQENIRGIMQYYQRQGPDDLEVERAALLRVRRCKAELEVAELERRSIPFDEVETIFTQLLSMWATSQDGIAGRCAGQVAAESDPGKCRQILLDEQRAIRADAAAAVRKWAEANRPREGGTGTVSGEGAGSVGGSERDTAGGLSRTGEVPVE